METKSYYIIVASDNSKLAIPIPTTWLKLEIGNPVPVIGQIRGQIYEWYRPLTNRKSKSEKYAQVNTVDWITNFGRILAIESNNTHFRYNK